MILLAQEMVRDDAVPVENKKDPTTMIIFFIWTRNQEIY